MKTTIQYKTVSKHNLVILLPYFAEGMIALFVCCHVPSHLAMVKCGGSGFQFCENAAIYPRFLVRVGLIVTVDTTYPINSVPVSVYTPILPSVLLGTYPRPRDQNNLEAPEWRSGLWHCISVQEVSLQSLGRIQAVLHQAVIESPIGRRTIVPASSGFGWGRPSL